MSADELMPGDVHRKQYTADLQVALSREVHHLRRGGIQAGEHLCTEVLTGQKSDRTSESRDWVVNRAVITVIPDDSR